MGQVKNTVMGGYKLFHFMVFLFFLGFFFLGKILSNYDCINKVFEVVIIMIK
jgi:hypothetical protein